MSVGSTLARRAEKTREAAAQNRKKELANPRDTVVMETPTGVKIPLEVITKTLKNRARRRRQGRL